jgi:hypothetical protein
LVCPFVSVCVHLIDLGCKMLVLNRMSDA